MSTSGAKSKDKESESSSALASVVLAATAAAPVAFCATSLKDEDERFRAKIVGQDQVGIERSLIESENGVFVLFTPTHGTPLMISEQNEIPDGLIPKDRMASFDSSVKPRVETTHQMPKAGIRCIFIRHQQHRPHAEEPSKNVDEKHYQAFLAKYPQRIVDKVIDAQSFSALSSKDMPAAFYYHVPKGNDKPQFAAIFAKQINSAVGNQLSNAGTYFNREQDLAHVDEMLNTLGLKSLAEIRKIEDVRHAEITPNVQVAKQPSK